MIQALVGSFSQIQWQDVVDILVLFFLLYNLIILTKETRAYQVLKGVAFIFLAATITQFLELTSLSWLLNALLSSGIIVAVVLFQPELRRALEHLGRGKLFDKSIFLGSAGGSSDSVAELSHAILSLSKKRIGALIVIECKTGLGDIISTGTRIEGIISSALVENIFEPNTPLHDGATIIRNQMIVAAGCFLPLSDEGSISRELGTRHRAALGISSVSDSITIVVSEETGVISYAQEGRLVRYIDSKALSDLLTSVFLKEQQPPFSITKRRTKDGKK